MKHPHISDEAGPATLVALRGWPMIGFGAGLAVGVTHSLGLGPVGAETCAPEHTPEPLALPAPNSPARSAMEGPRPRCGLVRAGPHRAADVSWPSSYGSSPPDSSSLRARRALLRMRKYRRHAADEVAA